MTIAEVSKEYDLTPDTLRYYERIGLLPHVQRNASGIRNYSESDLKWVEFIKCMRNAGLSIEVLAEYVSLFQEGHSTVGARKQLLMEQRSQLAQRIEHLQVTLSRLDKKIESYDELMVSVEEDLKRE
ncbi:MAG: MerR family transcriptional regulator [bacterium]|nr:MerR family transcriptional regulator [bacterium]